MSNGNIIKMQPPDMVWVDIEEQPLTTQELVVLFYGRINLGSEYEQFNTFFAQYDPDIGIMDAQGDTLDGFHATHYLKEVKYGEPPWKNMVFDLLPERKEELKGVNKIWGNKTYDTGNVKFITKDAGLADFASIVTQDNNSYVRRFQNFIIEHKDQNIMRGKNPLTTEEIVQMYFRQEFFFFFGTSSENPTTGRPMDNKWVIVTADNIEDAITAINLKYKNEWNSIHRKSKLDGWYYGNREYIAKNTYEEIDATELINLFKI